MEAEAWDFFWFTIWQVNASDVIILEGILVFHEQRVRDVMNMKIFVDTGLLFSQLDIVPSNSIINYKLNKLKYTKFCLSREKSGLVSTTT